MKRASTSSPAHTTSLSIKVWIRIFLAASLDTKAERDKLLDLFAEFKKSAVRGSATRVSVDPPEDQGDISVAAPPGVSVDPPEDFVDVSIASGGGGGGVSVFVPAASSCNVVVQPRSYASVIDHSPHSALKCVRNHVSK